MRGSARQAHRIPAESESGSIGEIVTCVRQEGEAVPEPSAEGFNEHERQGESDCTRPPTYGRPPSTGGAHDGVNESDCDGAILERRQIPVNIISDLIAVAGLIEPGLRRIGCE